MIFRTSRLVEKKKCDRFLEGNLSKLQVLQIVRKVIGPCPLDLSLLELNFHTEGGRPEKEECLVRPE